MKKRKNSQFTLSIFVLALLALIPTGCEKESIEENNFNSNTLATENHVSYVNQNQIPNVIHAIYELTGNTSMKTAPNQKTISYNKTKIKTDKILKVKNKGFVNYTFKVLIENAPSNEFYNLIVTEDDTKKIKKPYILKYVVDNDALSLFKANNQNFNYFKGKQIVISFDSFFNNKNSNLKTSNEPCPESFFYINNTPSSGGGDGGIYNVPPTNFLQPVFGYNPTNLTGYFNLWINSYNTTTNQSTTYIGSVSASTAVAVNNVTGNVAPISPLTGGSSINSAIFSAQPPTPYSTGGTLTITRYYELDGTRYFSITIKSLDQEEQNYRNANEINECLKYWGRLLS